MTWTDDGVVYITQVHAPQPACSWGHDQGGPSAATMLGGNGNRCCCPRSAEALVPARLLGPRHSNPPPGGSFSDPTSPASPTSTPHPHLWQLLLLLPVLARCHHMQTDSSTAPSRSPFTVTVSATPSSVYLQPLTCYLAGLCLTSKLFLPSYASSTGGTRTWEMIHLHAALYLTV